MNERSQRERIADALQRAGLSTAAAWIQYFALGGDVPPGTFGPVLQDGPATEAIRQLGAAGTMLLDPEVAEHERLRSLGELHLLDTEPGQRFDRIIRRAAERFGCEVATLALIAHDRQFIKSAVGEANQDLERTQAFCDATIRSSGSLVLPDTLQDERFQARPFEASEPRIRFYAGCPLRGPGGWLVGTLCIMSRSPRHFTRGTSTTSRPSRRRCSTRSIRAGKPGASAEVRAGDGFPFLPGDTSTQCVRV